MTIINPDHEAVIAAFHRAAARAGTGGDGRYARAVTQLEPSVRRDLEARAEPQAPSGDIVESPCPRCGKPVLSWTRIPEATAVCLHCTEIAPQPPAEAQAQGDRLAIKLLVAAGYVTEAKANEALNIAHGFDKGPLAPPSAPVGMEASCHPCTSILIEGLKRLEGGSDALAEWDRARANADAALAANPGGDHD